MREFLLGTQLPAAADGGVLKKNDAGNFPVIHFQESNSSGFLDSTRQLFVMSQRSLTLSISCLRLLG